MFNKIIWWFKGQYYNVKEFARIGFFMGESIASMKRLENEAEEDKIEKKVGDSR